MIAVSKIRTLNLYTQKYVAMKSYAEKDRSVSLYVKFILGLFQLFAF